MEEPSVLDYIKSKLSFRRGRQIDIDWQSETQELNPGEAGPAIATAVEESVERPRVNLLAWPWQIAVGLMLAIAAQYNLEPAHRSLWTAVILYAMAGLMILWAALNNRLEIPALKRDADWPFSLNLRWPLLVFSIVPLAIAFFMFGGNRLNYLNLLLLAVGLGCVLAALWIPGPSRPAANLREWLRKFRFGSGVVLRIRPWTILLLLVLLLAAFFRFYQLSQIPGEMWSDHAEKLLDVQDVLHGQWSIFFPRNTGREAFQMYLTAFIARYLGLGISFLSLKLGTAICGFLTLPYIYLLGKELGNRWVGFFALLLAGFAYWPNLMARAGLRYTLYPFFTAPVLYYLLRGLRTSNRNDFIFAGIALGIGLHGYSPFRIVPFVVVIAIILYLLHAQSKGKRWETVLGTLIVVLVSLVVFLPLLRYILEDPSMFTYRALTRLGEAERPFPGPVWQIFLSNLWTAWVMPFWSNGNIWVHSIPDRPALDMISAAIYFIGTLVVVVRYVQRRHWADLFLLVSVPLLMMPSILSLAFPDENPSLNRPAGAYIPIFVIAAIGLESILASLWKSANSRFGQGLIVFWTLVIIAATASTNYDLVFRQYNDGFMAGAWNTSDIGQVVHNFANSIGTPETAYVVPFPYWVDTRLVGMNAGYPEKDYALWPENFNTTLNVPGPKLFIVKEDDKDDLAKLKIMYPSGRETLFQAARQGKNFFMFLVPRS